jgi:hypothetical protein
VFDEVGLISGVSGGSILAGYYNAFGDEVFTRFERDYLLVNFQSNLVRDILLAPDTVYKLSSLWYGRSNALAQRLDTVFRGSGARTHNHGAICPGPCDPWGHTQGPRLDNICLHSLGGFKQANNARGLARRVLRRCRCTKSRPVAQRT